MKTESEGKIEDGFMNVREKQQGEQAASPGGFGLGGQKVTPFEMEFTEAGKFPHKQLCGGRGRLLGTEEEARSGLWSVPERELKRRKRKNMLNAGPQICIQRVQIFQVPVSTDNY